MNYDHFQGLAQALFEESGDALFLFDPDTEQIVEVNSLAQRLSGFSLWELRQMPISQVFRSEHPGALQRVQQASRKTVLFHSQEGYFLRTLDPEVWIAVSLTVSRLHVQPKTLGLITARDMRESHAAQQRLRQTESELRRVLASVPACLWSAEVDAAGKCAYRYFSPVVEKLTGRSPDFFLASFNRWWSVIHPDDQPRWEKAFVRLRSGQPTQEDYRVFGLDDTFRWVRDSARMTRSADGTALQLDGVLTDITEWKQAQEALQEGQERLKAFLDNSPAVAFMKDHEGRYVFINRPYRHLFQKAPAEFLGKTDFEIFPAQVARELRKNDAQVLSRDKPLEVVEAVPTADGVLRQWLVLKFPFPDRSGQRFLGGVAVDITAQKHAERALQESEARFRSQAINST